jgi:23S rRNA (adenine2503-C2)-methyltransferase
MTVANLFDFSLPELSQHIQGIGKEKFRAQQLFKWVYQKRVTNFDEMTDLSKSFRQELPSLLSLQLPAVLHHGKSVDGTQKFLFRVGDGLTVESVLIPSEGRLTLCISSEVGCNMACKFCFTGKQKLKRRLTTSEIVGQFYQVQKLLGDVRITNVVFMGMGEPLDNPEHVFRTIEILHDPFGFNLSKKKITVSTSGLVPQIPLVTDSGARLAVSLNAPNDEIRNQIMPINKKYPLKELLEACKVHAEKSRDRITFEYVLLRGVTDDLDHARQVAKLLRGVPAKINLIPFNEHPDSGYQRPERQKVFAFQEYLLGKGYHVTVRKTMGRDIYAACGQLTSHFENHPRRLEAATGVLG